MNRKISLGLCISLIIIFVTATFAVTMVVSKEIYSDIISGISPRTQTYKSIEEISALINNNYYFGSTEDNNKIDAALVEGYIDGLGDRNSVYLDASEYAEYISMIDGGLTGIGVETAYDYQKGFIITHVYEGSPAEKAGLKALDEITAIDNQPVTINNYYQLSEKLYGAMLTTVQVEYMRADETKVVEPMRGFSIPSVTGRVERGNVGYIRITGFYKNTASDFEETAKKLVEQGAESMIFDIRNTDSGTIEYAAHAIDVVLPTIEGKIASIKDRAGNELDVFPSKTGGITMPFVVLVNGATSGPAELFACVLRDNCSAQIVGTKTAGVGTVQKIFPLDNGGAVLLTHAIVEPSKGEEAIYHEKGIAPADEYVVTLIAGENTNLELLTVEEDSQLSKALEILAS